MNAVFLELKERELACLQPNAQICVPVVELGFIQVKQTQGDITLRLGGDYVRFNAGKVELQTEATTDTDLGRRDRDQGHHDPAKPP